MRAGILSFAFLALGGCSLLLGTDDLAGNGETPSADGGGSSSGGDGSGPGSGDASTSTDAPADAADGGRKRFGPLLFIQSQDSWKTRVDGFFELTFPAAKFKHPTEWIDLTGGAPVNLAGAPALYQPPRADVFVVCNGWCDDTKAGGEAGVVDVVDDTPALVSFNTYMHHTAPSGVDVKRWARFTVHATGRVVVEVALANGAPSSWTADEWTYHDVQLSTQVDWQRVELANKSAYAFFPQHGASSLTMINQAGETTSGGGETEVRWTMGQATLAQGDTLTKLGEIQLGATMGDVSDRVSDVRNPALEVLSGGNGAASTYVLATGVYAIEATSGTLTFGVGPTRTRYNPTFEIRSFTAPSWKLSLDGVVLASAQTPVTEHAVAKYDAINGRLVVAYSGVIPANAPAAKRTFVLER